MGLKYRGYFNSISTSNLDSVQYRVDLYEDGYEDTEVEICLGSPSLVEKATSSKEKVFGVKDCRITIKILSPDGALTLEDFYVTGVMSNRVEIYEEYATNQYKLIRIGYLLAEEPTEAYEDGTKVIEVTMSDGLELLEGIPFEIEPDKKNVGDMGMIEILYHIFNKLEFPIDYWTAFPYEPDEDAPLADSESSLLNKLSLEVFGDDPNCYDVLEKIAETLNCQVFQEDGDWFVFHNLLPSGSTWKGRRWSYAIENTYLEVATFGNPVDALFDTDTHPVEGQRTMQRQLKKYTTTLAIGDEGSNQLADPDMQDNGFGLPGSDWVEWRVAHPVDSVETGGAGTKDDPYYFQINGFQPRLFAGANIGGVGQSEFLTIMSEGEDYKDVLNRAVRISGKVKGLGVKNAYVLAFIYIETTDNQFRYIPTMVSESGELIPMGVTNTGIFGLFNAKFNPIKNGIKLNLTDDTGVNYSEYTSFEVETDAILKFVFGSNGFWGLLDGGLWSANYPLKKVEPDEFKSVTMSFVVTEGHDKITGSGTQWVRWADLSVELLDRSRAVGLESNKYISTSDLDATDEGDKKATFGDYYNQESYVAIINAGTGNPTSTWTATTGNNNGDLLLALNRELLSLYADPVYVYDGDILGRPKKYDRFSMLRYDNDLICVNWGFDFMNARCVGVRLQMLPADYHDGTHEKFGLFTGGQTGDELVPYDGEKPATREGESLEGGGSGGGGGASTTNLFERIKNLLKEIDGPNTLLTGGMFNLEADEEGNAGIRTYDQTTGDIMTGLRFLPNGEGIALSDGAGNEMLLKTDLLTGSGEVDLNKVIEKTSSCGTFEKDGADFMTIELDNLGDGDVFEHTEGVTGMLIYAVYDANDNYRHVKDFYIEESSETETTFVLRNDFNSSKFTGIMTLVRPRGNSAYLLTIANKGDGDEIKHHKGCRLLVLAMYDADDDMKRYDAFYTEVGTDTDISFTLRNDFDSSKFNGKLLCVPY